MTAFKTPDHISGKMFSLLISVMSVLPGRSVSVPRPHLCDLTEIYMSKCLFVSHDIMTTFGYWGGLFFGLIISLPVKISRNPRKAKASETPQC